MVKIQVDIDGLSDICQPKEKDRSGSWGDDEDYNYVLKIKYLELSINACGKKFLPETYRGRRLELDVYGVDIDCREPNNWWGSGSPVKKEDIGAGCPFRDWYGSWYEFFADVAAYYKYKLTIERGKLALYKKDTEKIAAQPPQQLELFFMTERVNA